MEYCITTFCYGEKYAPISQKWFERITDKCKNMNCSILNDLNIKLNHGFTYAWWDVVRLFNNLSIIRKTNKPVVHIDLDLIIEKDIKPLVDLQYDLIISKEIGEAEAYPKECSKILGFGVCSGFYIIKPSAHNFMTKLYDIMSNNSVNYSDQVNLMNYIVNSNYNIKDEEIILDNIKYINKIIEVDDVF